MTMTKPVILTGLRANNDLTIGNYFGGILPMIDMAKTRADEFQVNMFIPDLHSFTTPINHDELYEQILHNARLFTAAGLPLDNSNIFMYRQSHIPAHSELTWILDCFTGFGQMKRMTQFKDKVTAQTTDAKHIERKIASYAGTFNVLRTYIGMSDRSDSEKAAINNNLQLMFDDMQQIMENEFLDSSAASVGLFNYPVLMAADILLYGAKYIPVGDDQTQHLEFTRDIAQRMNSRFGELFVVPEAVSKQHEFFGKDQGLRIKDLQDPTKKMSKSDESGKGVIYLGDDPDVAAKKVMSATTDDKAYIRFDRDNQPGISNLLEILALLRGQSIDTILSEFEGQTQYGAFKTVVATEVRTFLSNFQERLGAVDINALHVKLTESEQAMNEQANATLLKVQQAVGLRSSK